MAASSSMLKENIPSTGKDWITLKEGVEFQPAIENYDEDPQVQEAVEHARLRFLSDGKESESSRYEAQFIDGSETFYAVPSQAWRYIGFYVDCNEGYVPVDWDRRRLEEDTVGCGRYLLWAAVSFCIFFVVVSHHHPTLPYSLTMPFFNSTLIWTTKVVDLPSTKSSTPRRVPTTTPVATKTL
jgi:hypothetical protein